MSVSPDWLSPWTQTQGGTASLVNHSENHTFRMQSGQGAYYLRVHRPGYQSMTSIESELEWLANLRATTSLPVPEPLPGRDGRLLQMVRMPGDTDIRPAVLFAALPGREPDFADDLPAIFEVLGGFAAQLHDHAARFQPSSDFVRPIWDAQSILSPDGPWGDWRRTPRVTPAIIAVLEQLSLALAADLDAYGTAPARFGLIHADMRLGNVLLDGRDIAIIDFDDSGYGWYMYDFGAAVSFYEDHPLVPDLKRRWLAGYRRFRALPETDVAAIDSMIMLRRMALLAWIGSHGETALAQAHATGFAENSGKLAQRYLAGLPIS